MIEVFSKDNLEHFWRRIRTIVDDLFKDEKKNREEIDTDLNDKITTLQEIFISDLQPRLKSVEGTVRTLPTITPGKELTVKFSSPMSLYFYMSMLNNNTEYVIASNTTFTTYSGKVIRLRCKDSSGDKINVGWYVNGKKYGYGNECYIITTDDLSAITVHDYNMPSSNNYL